MRKLCKLNGTMLGYASKELKKDKELVLEAVRSTPEAFHFCDESFNKDNTVVYEAAKHASFNITKIDGEMFNRRKFVLALMEYRPEIFIHLPYELKTDPKVLNLAPCKNLKVLSLVPPSYQKDRDFVLKCVRNNGLDLEFAHPSLRKDREVVMEAVKQNGLALEFSSEMLRNQDREIVYEAVKSNGNAIEFTSDQFKRDLELARMAVMKNHESFMLVDSSIKQDKKLIQSFLEETGYYYYIASNELKTSLHDTIRGDRDLLGLAILKDETLLEEPLPDFVDEEFMLNAVRNGFSLDCVPQKFKQNEEIILESIRHASINFKYVDSSLASNRDFVLKCVKASGFVLFYTDEKFRMDREIILETLKATTSGSISLDWSESHPFNSDREILLECVRGSGDLPSQADSNIMNDPEFIVECVKIGKDRNKDITDYLEKVRNTILSNESLFLKLVKINPKIVESLNLDLDFLTLAFNSLT
ncbi:predicted protein [Naegleria gruberi]|uniref:Predicted protein n=1 Tax=Naegleria gruberi TaxID=5762 RepID=D2VYN2_NAEGR|nr:uncharacterized protein NAEGRDRAFT_74180 [Naegleria gruberi]EFC38085.1 predicted protein [Naegleria gruberi]|eukprot:XP_002670829.1 predicted protein [Naegleria gruberi strain NEG-M]